MNKQFLSKSGRLFLVCILAGLLATASFYVPMMTTTAYACQAPTGGC